MSLRALTWVLEHSPTTLSERLVLIALADHADRDGLNSFPGVTLVARQARVSERTVQRSLRVLETGGHIKKVGKTVKGNPVWQVVMTQIGDDNVSDVGVTNERMSPEPKEDGGGREEQQPPQPPLTGPAATVAEAMAVFRDAGLAVDEIALEAGVGNAIGAFPNKDVVFAARQAVAWLLGRGGNGADVNVSSALMTFLSKQPEPEARSETTAAAMSIGQRHKEGCDDCGGMAWVEVPGSDEMVKCVCHPKYGVAA